jgi:hypothetical protein
MHTTSPRTEQKQSSGPIGRADTPMEDTPAAPSRSILHWLACVALALLTQWPK